jgi:hypothetical protein
MAAPVMNFLMFPPPFGSRRRREVGRLGKNLESSNISKGAMGNDDVALAKAASTGRSLNHSKMDEISRFGFTAEPLTAHLIERRLNLGWDQKTSCCNKLLSGNAPPA